MLPKGRFEPRHYTGVFSHPYFGPEEIRIEFTLRSPTEGQWKAMDQAEDVTVRRNGKSVLISDKAGVTVLDGHESVGGMFVGVVVQNGVRGGRFRLQPCSKSRVLLKSSKACFQRPVKMEIPAMIWRSVGIPAKMSVQSTGESSWRTSYQTAFS